MAMKRTTKDIKGPPCEKCGNVNFRRFTESHETAKVKVQDNYEICSFCNKRRPLTQLRIYPNVMERRKHERTNHENFTKKPPHH
jgi:hypothetical protein